MSIPRASASLVGPPGPPGAAGAAGAPGPRGIQGDPGGSTHSQQTYALFAGVATDGWWTANTLDLDITDEIDIVAWVEGNPWVPVVNSVIYAQFNTSGAHRGPQLFVPPTGTLQFQFSADGSSTVTSLVSASVIPAPAVGPLAIRCHAKASDAGSSSAAFYTAEDGATWVPLGAKITGALPAGGVWHSDSTPKVMVGTNEASPTAGVYAGKIYRVEIWHGDSTASGTLVAVFDATNLNSVAAFTGPDGRTWTPLSTSAIASDKYVTRMNFKANSLPQTVLEGGSLPAYVKRSYMMQDTTYGAVFDGVTETSTQMLAAQTALTTATPTPNGNLYTGRGIAMVNKGLVVKNKVKWIGEGRDGTVIKPHSTYPATKVTLTRASVTAGGTTVTLSSTADFSFASTDVGRLVCVPTAGPGGSMTVEKIATVTDTTHATINTRTTFVNTVTNGEAYVCTPLVEIGDAGAFYCGLEGIHLDGKDFQGGTGLTIGVWTEFAQEQCALAHYLLSGFSLGAIRSPVTSGAEKNFSVRDGEILSGSGGPQPHANADMVRLHGSITFDRNTVIGSNTIGTPWARSCIALDGVTGVVSGNHTEGAFEGVIIGEGAACHGLSVVGHGGHYDQTTDQFRIAHPPTSENTGIAIQTPSIGGAAVGTPIMVKDQDVHAVDYGEGGTGVTTGVGLVLYARGRAGATPTRIV